MKYFPSENVKSCFALMMHFPAKNEMVVLRTNDIFSFGKCVGRLRLDFIICFRRNSFHHSPNSEFRIPNSLLLRIPNIASQYEIFSFGKCVGRLRLDFIICFRRNSFHYSPNSEFRIPNSLLFRIHCLIFCKSIAFIFSLFSISRSSRQAKDCTAFSGSKKPIL